MNLVELYDGIDASTQPMVEGQPWWPCANCPVLGQPENCCNYAMFLVTRTEWDYLREHPFVQQNLKTLRKEARRALHRLRSAGHDLSDWGAVCKAFGNDDNPIPFRCPLLGSDGLCSVYDRRPSICRAYGMTHYDDGESMYACQVVTQAIDEHGGAKALPLTPILETLASFAQGPTMPIVAWLAEET